MSRQARVVVPHVPVHVTQRGNRRENIFLDDEDKEYYMKSFMFYKKKCRVKLYAWCIMDNHIHFVLEPSTKTGLSKLFAALNTKYVKYFNKKYGLCGRLFGDRFFSCLLDEDHLYEAIRYVELNPWRAKMEVEIGTYFWSSSWERLKKRSQFFLSKLPEYLKISNWLQYLMEPINEEILLVNQTWEAIRSFTNGGTPLGKESFVQRIKSKVGAIFREQFREFNPLST